MAESHISQDIDVKVHKMARDYYQDGKKRSAESLPELKVMISGTMDDGTPSSLVVRIKPNPINPRLASGWKIVAQDKVWEVPPEEMEKSRLL